MPQREGKQTDFRRKSALKHLRADPKKRERNFRRKSAMRTMVKKTEAVIEGQDLEQAQELFRQAASHLDRAAQKGIIKKGTANRKKSRLARRINSMTAA